MSSNRIYKAPATSKYSKFLAAADLQRNFALSRAKKFSYDRSEDPHPAAP